MARTAILSSYRWDLVGCIVVNLNKCIWCWLALCARCTAWRTSGWSPTARKTPVLSAGGWTWFSHLYAKMRIMHLQGEINSPIKEPREEIYFSGLCIHKEKRFSGNIATKWTKFSGYVATTWRRWVFAWIMESHWSDNFVQAVTVTSEQDLAGPAAVDKGRARDAIGYKISGLIMET